VEYDYLWVCGLYDVSDEPAVTIVKVKVKRDDKASTSPPPFTIEMNVHLL
jgi:hypothetical protein